MTPPSDEVSAAEGRGPERCTSPDCRVPEQLLHEGPDGNWWCYQHDPDPALDQQRKAAATRGGLAMARRTRRGIDEAELGPLDSPSDAQRWSHVIAVSVLSGVITAPQAHAGNRSVSLWLSARSQQVREDQLANALSENARLVAELEHARNQLRLRSA